MKASHNDCFVYIGTGSPEGIFLARLEPSKGRLSPATKLVDISHPSFLSINPKTSCLYASQKNSAPVQSAKPYEAVNAFRIDRTTGQLHFINSQRVQKLSFLHLAMAPQGDFLLATSYFGKKAAGFPVFADGSLAKASSLIPCNHDGSKVVPDRQSEPFPHSFSFNPQGSHAFLCDLGADKVFIFRREANQLLLHEQEYLELPPGSGPRHITYHPDGNYLYILNELNASIAVCTQRNGYLKIKQLISTLPESITQKNTSAEIQLSQDVRFLYCSNRAHGSNHECLSSYKILEDGQLEPLEFVATDRHPRSFCLDSSGQCVLVANRDSNNLVLYLRDPKTGKLERTSQEISVPRPICVQTLEL